MQGLGVSTDGSRAAIERARTALTAAFPDRAAPATVAENRADGDIARQLAGFQRLALVVTIGSLCIAGCSLAVSVVAGLNDRKRPFSLLRLAGVPLAALRRSMALETAVPLLSVAAVAVGMGFLAAALFLRSQLHYALHPPGVAFWVTVAAGLAAVARRRRLDDAPAPPDHRPGDRAQRVGQSSTSADQPPRRIIRCGRCSVSRSARGSVS